jgi:hypothetical protein
LTTLLLFLLRHSPAKQRTVHRAHTRGHRGPLRNRLTMSAIIPVC